MGLSKHTWSGCNIFYVPELNGTEAGIIGVGHHSIHDAVTQFQSYYMLCDEGGEYPFVKKAQPSFFQWCMIYLTAPFTWPGVLKHYLSRKSDKNCIKPHGKFMSGNLNSRLGPEVSLKKTKEIAKKMNMTVNDLMLGITSKVLKQYFVKQGDTSSEITITLPFTFKVIAQKKQDYTYGNNFVSLTIFLKLIDNLEAACEHAKKQMNDLKRSSRPGAFYTLLEFYSCFMPQWFCNTVSQASGAKHSIMFSNVPGYMKPTYYLGSLAKRFYYSGVGTGNISSGIVIVSMLKRFQICITSDETQIKDVDLLMDLYNKQMQELGMMYSAKEEGQD